MRRQDGVLLALLAVMVGGVSVASRADIMQWSAAEGGNDHFYEAVLTPGPITWGEAMADALDRGGHLVTLTSAEENAFVFSLIESPDYWTFPGDFWVGPWIGGIQQPGSAEPAGGWAWVTGELFDFAAWDTIQPNNAGSNQDRIHFWGQHGIAATWQDVWQNDSHVHNYVIEYSDPSAVVPLPASALLGALGLGTAGWRLRRRKAS